MRQTERRLKLLERARASTAKPFLIVRQDRWGDQPDQFIGAEGEFYTEQQLESLAARFTVIKIVYGEWSPG